VFNPTIKIVRGIDLSGNFAQAVKKLTSKSVLVGVPRATAQRKGDSINNAALAYVHDQGSPARGIPAREFLRPGIRSVQPELANRFKAMGQGVIAGKDKELDKGLVAIGLIAQKAVRKKIIDGPFKPLRPATIRARRRRGVTRTKPLIDSGAMMAAISFVINDKK
jgi:hypothetical protein